MAILQSFPVKMAEIWPFYSHFQSNLVKMAEIWPFYSHFWLIRPVRASVLARPWPRFHQKWMFFSRKWKNPISSKVDVFFRKWINPILSKVDVFQKMDKLLILRPEVLGSVYCSP